MERILLDTGPLVALLKRDDVHHAACSALAKTLTRPWDTSWLVIAEAAWLLRHIPDGCDKILSMVEEGLIAPANLGPEAAPWLRTFLAKYGDLRPQLADASLCYLAEREGIETIFTLDRRDFAVFRRANGNTFRLLPTTL